MDRGAENVLGARAHSSLWPESTDLLCALQNAGSPVMIVNMFEGAWLAGKVFFYEARCVEHPLRNTGDVGKASLDEQVFYVEVIFTHSIQAMRSQTLVQKRHGRCGSPSTSS